ncbi:MAG: hypothetical protein EZS28_031888 [Streblomastix strix]|uniref:Uncharacterized protein n=1 Tax=Streblomastix strix TaxID=222440 RepID=A0A5J4UQX6_9EUKA|nr:MAG: hypothetical protein EZS28_031888 [Streblomastix strix]
MQRLKIRENQLPMVEQEFLHQWRIHIRAASHQRQLLHHSICELQPNSAVLIGDYKQNIKLEMRREEEGKFFFEKVPVSVLSFVAHIRRCDGSRIKRVFTVFSRVLNKSAQVVKKCLKMILDLDEMKDINHIDWWSDGGSSFRNIEYLTALSSQNSPLVQRKMIKDYNTAEEKSDSETDSGEESDSEEKSDSETDSGEESDSEEKSDSESDSKEESDEDEDEDTGSSDESIQSKKTWIDEDQRQFTINFFVPSHGKSECDSVFGQYSQILKQNLPKSGICSMSELIQFFKRETDILLESSDNQSPQHSFFEFDCESLQETAQKLDIKGFMTHLHYHVTD